MQLLGHLAVSRRSWNRQSRRAIISKQKVASVSKFGEMEAFNSPQAEGFGRRMSYTGSQLPNNTAKPKPTEQVMRTRDAADMKSLEPGFRLSRGARTAIRRLAVGYWREQDPKQLAAPLMNEVRALLSLCALSLNRLAIRAPSPTEKSMQRLPNSS